MLNNAGAKMSKAKLKVERATAEEIRLLLRKDEKYMIGVRLYAVYQIASGAVSRDLEKIYNVSFKSVCNWVHAFNKFGVEGLKNDSRSGRKPRLSLEQLEILKSTILNKNPTEFNYNTSTWTGPLLIDYIEKQFGVKFKKAQIYNVMKKMKLSYQKGKGVYPDADADKRAEYDKELKKNEK
jgi:transposase